MSLYNFHSLYARVYYCNTSNQLQCRCVKTSTRRHTQNQPMHDLLYPNIENRSQNIKQQLDLLWFGRFQTTQFIRWVFSPRIVDCPLAQRCLGDSACWAVLCRWTVSRAFKKWDQICNAKKHIANVVEPNEGKSENLMHFLFVFPLGFCFLFSSIHDFSFSGEKMQSKVSLKHRRE